MLLLHSLGSILAGCRSGNPLFEESYQGSFHLEWKSTLKIVESTLKRVFQTTTLEWIPLFWEWISTPNEVIPNMTPKRVDFHSTALREYRGVRTHAKSFNKYCSHTSYCMGSRLYTHLDRKSSNVDIEEQKVSCWRTKSAGQWREPNSSHKDRSRERRSTPIYHDTSHRLCSSFDHW